MLALKQLYTIKMVLIAKKKGKIWTLFNELLYVSLKFIYHLFFIILREVFQFYYGLFLYYLKYYVVDL